MSEQLQKPESNIVEKVAAFIRRFVFLREAVLYDLTAVWVVGTYLKDLFDYAGYIFAYSPEPESGKTRFLEVLHCLVKDSSGLLVSPTEAVLFRTASKMTQLLDEVDSWGYADSLKGVLNAGFERNGLVYRTHEVNGGRGLEKHSVFGPKALAGIGTRILSAPTRDRTFMFEMVRQTKGEKREKLRIRKIEPDAKFLKEEIEKWSEANKTQVAELYDKADLAMPYLDDFGDRTTDIAQPLAAIVEVAYANNPKLETARSRLTQAISLTRNEQQSSTDQHKVIRQLSEIARLMDEDPLVGNATELSQMFTNLLADSVLPDTISTVLRNYGFKVKSCRKGGGDPKYRYELPKAKLAEILERYAAEELPEAEPAEGEPQLPEMAELAVMGGRK
jgi:hypothetical protein